MPFIPLSPTVPAVKHPDLNLLAHFDALVSCRNVSRAAEQMRLSQPAMSAALSRLRRLFNDPLLVRDGPGWKPTARALELHRTFAPILAQWRLATTPLEEFDPATSKRAISIYATDYVQFTVFPRVAARVAREAPNMQLRVFPARLLHGLSMLDTNHVELIAGYYPEPAPNLRTRYLFEEPTVCLVGAGHPSLERPWNLDAYLRYGHIDLAAHTRHFSERIDRALEGLGRSRRLAMTLSSYLACPHVVATTDLIATLPRSVASALAPGTRTVMREVPLALPMLSVSLYWHERYQHDPAHAWLRQTIAELF